jgi:hypothetical protein
LSSAVAQTDLSPPIDVNTLIRGLWWSSDSKAFVFSTSLDSLNIESPDAFWYSYSVDTGLLTTSKSWPLQPNLAVVSLADSSEVDLSDVNGYFNYLSPDGLAAVVTANQVLESNVSLRNPIAGNISISNSTLTDFVPFALEGVGPDGYRIQWSEDSSTFGFSARTPLVSDLVYFYYVTGLKNADGQLRVFNLQPTLVNTVAYSIFEILDLSSDGTRVLLRGQDAATRSPFALIVWEGAINTGQNVPGISGNSSYTLWAAFSTRNPNLIRAVTEQGLVEYDLESNTMRVLEPEINSTRFNRAMFSPDGQYVALVETYLDAEDYLYIVPVP